MACRRRDRRNFIGCNIGVVANRGCGRGCCPFPDDQLFTESHAAITPGEPYVPTDAEKADRVAQGRTNLRWQSCGSLHHRPKFVCIKPQCRRVFKPFVDEQKFEYSITRDGWAVRYRPEHNEDLKCAMHQPYKYSERRKELKKRFYATEDAIPTSYGKGIELLRRSQEDPEGHVSDKTIYTPQTSIHEDELVPLSSEEIVELLRFEADLWWQDIVRQGDDHNKRCPNCGGRAIRVGSNFRAPKKEDDAAWDEIMRQYHEGVDMHATYTYCTTVEEFNEGVKERDRLANMQVKGWEEEKRRRLEVLGLLPHQPRSGSSK